MDKIRRSLASSRELANGVLAAEGTTKLLAAARYAPKGFAGRQLEAHFAKHSGEWGAGSITRAAYLKRPWSLLGKEVGGDILRYERRNQRVSRPSPDGTIRMLFRPQEGIAYWLKQVGP